MALIIGTYENVKSMPTWNVIFIYICMMCIKQQTSVQHLAAPDQSLIGPNEELRGP